jgi:predicted phage terminase large subunit-like protein
MTETTDWMPNPGPQTAFLRSGAFEVLYGGAAGGGKSEALLVEALRYAHRPGYSAVLFRRTFPELQQSLMLRSHELYPRLGGVYRVQEREWRFPSGARIRFGHLSDKRAHFLYQSAEFAYIGFDELTSFEEEQYLYLFSRARSVAGVPVRVRAATNPGGVGHEWVKARFIDKLEPTRVRFFKRVDEVDVEVSRETGGALSRQFIPATVRDNPQIMASDPLYLERLNALPLVERERLLHGNWDIQPVGNVFQVDWFRVVKAEPGAGENEGRALRWVRFWDLAVSVKTSADYTASARVALAANGTLYIADMLRFRAEWPDTRKRIVATAGGEPGVRVAVEKVAFQLAAIQDLRRAPEMAATSLLEVRPDRDKLSRALAWSSRAEAGKVALVDGPWVPGFIAECVAFSGDGTTHDDQVDAVSGAVQVLATRQVEGQIFY